LGLFSKNTVNIVHTDFDKAFEQDRLFVREDERLKMHVENIGTLVIKSGRVLAHDPGSLHFVDQSAAFTKTVPKGEYPVFAAIANPVDNPDAGVICAAMVRFTNEPISKWEIALKPGESISQLKDGSDIPFAHGVDSGFSCFVDFGAIKTLPEEDREVLFSDKIVSTLSERHGVEYGSVELSDNGESIVVFKSGFGDGGYSDYWGYSKNGSICALATDFFILIEETKATIDLPADNLKKGQAIRHPQLDQFKLNAKVVSLSNDELTIECVGQRSYDIDLQFLDEKKNSIARQIASSSEGDDSSFTYQLLEPLTDKTTLSLTFFTGEKPLS